MILVFTEGKGLVISTDEGDLYEFKHNVCLLNDRLTLKETYASLMFLFENKNRETRNDSEIRKLSSFLILMFGDDFKMN